jgi:hypothetical protein
MKRRLLCSLLVLILVVSCQKEIDFLNNNGSGSGNGTASNNCKACIYLPYCDGSVYTYYDTLTGSAPAVLSETLHFVKDTSFNGRVYQKFLSGNNPTASYINCTNGTSRIAVLNVSATGGSIDKIELQFLKDNVPVNGTWIDTIQNGFGQTVLYTNVIKQKGVSRTLHSNNFTDVIYVETENGIDLAGVGYIATGVSHYYFARGVGLIEALITSADGSIVYQHRVIKSYSIP